MREEKKKGGELESSEKGCIFAVRKKELMKTARPFFRLNFFLALVKTIIIGSLNHTREPSYLRH